MAPGRAGGTGGRASQARVSHGAGCRRCRRTRDRRRGDAARLQRALEPVHPLGEQHHRRAGVAPREADERDLEHEARVGGVDAPHVDHGLPQRLDHADERGVAERVAELPQPRELLLRTVDMHTSGAGVEQERVARRAQQVVGHSAGLVTGVEQ